MTTRFQVPTVTLLVALAIAIALGEAVLRLATRTARNGMLAVGNVPLLPYRLDADNVRRWFAESGNFSYIIRDDSLGWELRPGYRDSMYETNAQGIRAAGDRVYEPDPPGGKVRILAFGDSFTHCDDVTNDQTWESWLERARSDIEVVNLGVPAYGTDQAYLKWHKQGPSLGPQIVMLGILPENMCRNLGIVRYYLDPTGDLISKPRFLLTGDSLELINSPVFSPTQLVTALARPETFPMLNQDYWFSSQETAYRPYYVSRIARTIASVYTAYQRRELRGRLYSGEDPGGILLTVAIAERFAAEVRAAGAIPVILVIPMRLVLDDYPEENASPLVIALRNGRLNVVDPGPHMLRSGERDIIPYKGHFSGSGNRALAGELERTLQPWIDTALVHRVSAP